MSSINTNAAALTALQTLKATNKAMDVTQNRISTGYRVSEAAHNAAYWSIATTMRSDNKALSTVQDALGLGAAQVDVAYTALDTAKDLIDEMKKKVIAASQPGVDKAKVQSEISQIQSSLKSLAGSASFSGTNWLSVDSQSGNFKPTEKVVAAFTRGENGQISLGTVDVNVAGIALFDKGGAGLLERAEGIDNAGVLAETGTTGVTSVAGSDTTNTPATLTTGALVTSNIEVDDEFTFTLSVNGEDFTFTHVFAAGDLTGGVVNVGDLETAISTWMAGQTTVGGDDLTDVVTMSQTGGAFTFTTVGTGPSQTLEISGVGYTDDDPGSLVGSLSGFANVAEVTGTATGAPTAASLSFTGTFAAMTLDADDSITFTLDLDGTKHDIKIDKATIDAAGTATAGTIADAAEFTTVLNKAFANANITGTIAAETGGVITLTSGTAGADSKVEISALRHSSGSAAFDVVEMDISNATEAQLAGFAQGLDDVFNAVVTAASDLGAIKTRIDTQKEFVSKLTDALSRGIGQLVDADMEEESTRLQALQVQQQLGIQALSIANANSQNILSLFRG